MNAFEQELKRCQRAVEERLAGYFRGNDLPQRRLLEAMRYSMLAGGKRIRPVLTLKFCETAGGAPDTALPLACGVEMLHTYSLIHDDLPCMDNDDLRRGRPTNHRVFGESTATLAGDALQAAAIETILSAPFPPEVTTAAALELARAAGPVGMCGGQQLEMEGEKNSFTLEQVARMNGLKTGSLLRAACVMGVLAAGIPRTDPRVKAAAAYADSLGFAFQIRDDMLNCTSTEAEMGKPVGNDRQSHKSTYVTLLGLEGCAAAVRERTELAKEAIRDQFPDTAFLVALADYLSDRRT